MFFEEQNKSFCCLHRFRVHLRHQKIDGMSDKQLLQRRGFPSLAKAFLGFLG